MVIPQVLGQAIVHILQAVEHAPGYTMGAMAQMCTALQARSELGDRNGVFIDPETGNASIEGEEPEQSDDPSGPTAKEAMEARDAVVSSLAAAAIKDGDQPSNGEVKDDA